jgi:hypothetical protein
MSSSWTHRLVKVVVVAVVASAIAIGTSQGRPVRAATYSPTLVRGIDTSRWNPASPDPSGIVYLPDLDRVEVTDSEVDETTGAGYHDVNLWQLDRTTGAVKETGTTWTPVGFSKEPTGLGYIASSKTLLISDDSKNYVWLDRAGGDGTFGTTDDTRTFLDAGAHGSSDTEDPEYVDGRVYFLDGVTSTVYGVAPGNDGAFGTGDDSWSHFGIGNLGPSDWEGLSSTPDGHLLVGARKDKKFFEITTSGALVNTFDVSGISGLKYISGLAMAPGSDGKGDSVWIVDRQVDNGSQANENDGRLWEVRVGSGGGGDTSPPTNVTVTSPTAGATVSGTVTLRATASDDVGVTSLSFAVDDATVGNGSLTAGTSANGTWSLAWNSLLASNTSHVVRATARDAAGHATTSADVTFTVSNAAGSGSVDVKIANGLDDTEERSTGKVWKANADLDMMLDGSTPQTAVGLRFPNVQIPAGATVTAAWIQFWPDESRSDPTTLTIAADAVANSPQASTRNKLSTRTRTSGVTWTPDAWGTIDQPIAQARTPDLSSVVQQVVSLSGWAPGNAVHVIVTGSGRRVAESFEGGAAFAPVLHVEFTS